MAFSLSVNSLKNSSFPFKNWIETNLLSILESIILSGNQRITITGTYADTIFPFTFIAVAPTMIDVNRDVIVSSLTSTHPEDTFYVYP